MAGQSPPINEDNSWFQNHEGPAFTAKEFCIGWAIFLTFIAVVIFGVVSCNDWQESLNVVYTEKVNANLIRIDQISENRSRIFAQKHTPIIVFTSGINTEISPSCKTPTVEIVSSRKQKPDEKPRWFLNSRIANVCVENVKAFDEIMGR